MVRYPVHFSDSSSHRAILGQGTPGDLAQDRFEEIVAVKNQYSEVLDCGGTYVRS